MPSVCFYFQVHQPFRLKRFSYFDSSSHFDYFDAQKNGDIMRKVAHKCYLPTNRLIKQLIDETEGAFRVSYSITGIALEQMRLYSPETLESFVDLARTGCVEFLGETYYHSLSAIFDPADFSMQVQQHSKLMNELFGVQPTVFRNTELIYQDFVASLAEKLGFKGIIAEGCDDILQWRSPNFVYTPAGTSIKLLLKNYRLSDDIAFRFSNKGWESYPLRAETFASWVHSVSGNGETVNLFMDYETFGEHQWESTGIFDFLRHLPHKIFAHPDWNFATPSQVIDRYNSVGELHYHRLTSWADIDRDLTAWKGNRMQEGAFSQIYELGEAVRWHNDERLLDVWHKLLTSDHFYYMCTKWFADGDVHAYFSPYTNPYEAFINYMNVLRDFRRLVLQRNARQSSRAA
jgi:alpha-amylase